MVAACLLELTQTPTLVQVPAQVPISGFSSMTHNLNSQMQTPVLTHQETEVEREYFYYFSAPSQNPENKNVQVIGEDRFFQGCPPTASPYQYVASPEGCAPPTWLTPPSDNFIQGQNNSRFTHGRIGVNNTPPTGQIVGTPSAVFQGVAGQPQGAEGQLTAGAQVPQLGLCMAPTFPAPSAGIPVNTQFISAPTDFSQVTGGPVTADVQLPPQNLFLAPPAGSHIDALHMRGQTVAQHTDMYQPLQNPCFIPP